MLLNVLHVFFQFLWGRILDVGHTAETYIYIYIYMYVCMYLMKWILELPDVLLDKMFFGDILCFLLHEYFQLWVSLQHILIGLIISLSIVFGKLGVYNPSFLEMVGSGVCGLFDWVSKVLKCQQFTIKKCWDGGVPFFFSLGAICYFTFLQLSGLWFPSWPFRSEARKTLHRVFSGDK